LLAACRCLECVAVRRRGNLSLCFLSSVAVCQETEVNAIVTVCVIREKPIKICVAESRGAARPEGGDRRGLQGMSARERREREREGDRRGDRGGIRGTAFDRDEKEAEWMAKRVQEEVKIDDGAKAESPKVRTGAAANPFGDAKPRDQKEIEAAFEARMAERRKQEAEERRKKRESEEGRKAGDKSRGGAGKETGGDWRAGAAPPERRQRERREGGGDRPPRERKEREDRPPREAAAAAPREEAKPKPAPAAAKKEEVAAKPKAPANVFDLLGDGSDE